MKDDQSALLAALRAAGFARTQVEIAALLGVSQATVSNWISGRRQMSRPVRLLVARLLATETERAPQ